MGHPKQNYNAETGAEVRDRCVGRSMPERMTAERYYHHHRHTNTNVLLCSSRVAFALKREKQTGLQHPPDFCCYWSLKQAGDLCRKADVVNDKLNGRKLLVYVYIGLISCGWVSLIIALCTNGWWVCFETDRAQSADGINHRRSLHAQSADHLLTISP